MNPFTAIDTRVATILVCEDEAPLRELMQVSLGGEYRFLEAEDGHAALALARAERPDLMILDLMLPGLGGIEVLRELRADAATKAMPVLAVSAWSYVEREALEAGADAFVGKPFDPDVFRAAVEQLLSS